MLTPSQPEILSFDIATASGTRKLCCYRWGNPKAKKTVLCVHGLTRNGRDFDYLARALAEDFQVLCPDIAGRGKSQWLSPENYTPATYNADVMHILTTLEIKEVVWVGTSMGGIMGIMGMASQPAFIRALVLNDIGCLIPASGLNRIRENGTLANQYDSYAAAEAAFRKRCQPFGIKAEEHWQHLFKYGIEQRDTKWYFTYDPMIFTAGFSKDAPITDINLWPLWESVKSIPVLLVRGMESDILTHETAVEMQSQHPNLKLDEIPQCGHAPVLMETSQTTTITQWIKNQTE